MTFKLPKIVVVNAYRHRWPCQYSVTGQMNAPIKIVNFTHRHSESTAQLIDLLTFVD